MFAIRLLFCCGLAWCITGCGGDRGAAPVEPGKGADAVQAARKQCSELLGSVWDTFRLRNMGVSTDMTAGVSLLNQWRDGCADEAAPGGGKAPPELDKQFPSEWRDRMSDLRFSPRDGAHLRDCVLFKQVLGYATGRAENELGRVVTVFQHVIRSVSLISERAANVPLTPYEIYILGRGTAEERAWIFVSLLRQLKIDAVLLSAKEDNNTLLVGVLLDQVYLFDPRLGLPLPNREGSTNAKTPVATLTQAIADADVLRQFDLDGDHPYGLTAESLKSVRVLLVGNTAYWSERMRQLQTEFTGDRALVVSDPLADATGVPGLWSRVIAAGKGLWTTEAISVWEFPETQLAARWELTKEQSTALERLNGAWKVPQRVTKWDPVRNEVELGRPEGELLKMRLAHVQGDFEEAIVGYANLRLTNLRLVNTFKHGGPVEDDILDWHHEANDDATFWVGVCQFEQGRYSMAADTFQNYLDKRTNGAWLSSARYQLALAQFAQGDRAGAVKTLEGTPANDPQRAGLMVLLRQWQTPAATK